MLILVSSFRRLAVAAALQAKPQTVLLQQTPLEAMVSAKRAAPASTLRRSKRACVTSAAVEAEAASAQTSAKQAAAVELPSSIKHAEDSAAVGSPQVTKRTAKRSKKTAASPAQAAAQDTNPEPNTDEAAVVAAELNLGKQPSNSQMPSAPGAEEASAAEPDTMAASEPSPAARRKKPKASRKAAPATKIEPDEDHGQTPAEQLFSPVKAETSDGDHVSNGHDEGLANEDKPKKPRAKSAKQIRAEEARLAALDRLEKLVANPEQRIAEILASRPKKWIGAHVSASGGVERAPVNAAAVGEAWRCITHEMVPSLHGRPLPSRGSLATPEI